MSSRAYYQVKTESRKVMRLAYDKFKYSARSYHKHLKVVRTFADMEGSDKIRIKENI